MSGIKLSNKINNLLTIILLIIMGFYGILVFEGVVNYGGVNAISIIVDCNDQGDYTKIQNAIDNASIGDTIYVWAGEYNESIVINKELNLRGNGTENTTLNGIKSSTILISSNNVVIKNFKISKSGHKYYDASIKINQSDNCIVENNYIIDSNESGIIVINSNNNTIKNNRLHYNGRHGIFLFNSNSNYLENNYCTSNIAHGIFLLSSQYNILINNTCSEHYDEGDWVLSGIELNNSKYNEIRHNICLQNNLGILISDNSFNNILVNNFCFNDDIGISIKSNSNQNNLIKNNCSFNDYGIDLSYSSKNTLENNFCMMNNYSAIGLIYTYLTSINNNTCNLNLQKVNPYYGAISLEKSDLNFIYNNSCSWNNGSGINLINSDDNILEKNICNYNGYFDASIYGIFLGSNSGMNKIKNNICNSNSRTGIYILGSSFNDISNNICSLNAFENMAVFYSTYIMFKNNTCNSSFQGIVLDDSQHCILFNNSITSTYYAIRLDNADSNTIKNNYCYSNNYGIQLDTNAEYNEIIQNNFSNNEYGIALFSDSNFNRIYENIILNNSDRGFGIGERCNFNNIFYNIILFNNFQVCDESNNYWNNSDHEGNYWSDYTGLDNGADGRLSGDYIGDTLIPHLGVDYYPFTKLNGWLYPHIPVLFNPGNIDSDGTYKISWNKSKRSIGFILEESSNESFMSSLLIYNGSKGYFNISGKQDGTYFYHVKAYNNDFESDWSNIENISVVHQKNLPPVVNSSLKRIDIFEDSKNIGLINLSKWFIDPNDDVLNFKIKEMKNISAEILKNSSLSLTPMKDWNGNETLIIFANDTEYEISDSVIIVVLGVNDQPEKPIIIEPLNGTSFSNISKINFTGFCFDADTIYGDILNYTWISNISSILGYGTKLRNISLPSGKHEIIFKVRDLQNETNQTRIILEIYQLNITDNLTEITNETDTDNDLIPDIWEIKYGLNFSNPIDANLDFDNDNLTNYEEYLNGTNPLNPDTDGDAFNDKIEIENGTNPLDKDDYPEQDEPKPDKKKISQNNDYTIFIIVGIIIIFVLIIFGILINEKFRKKNKSQSDEIKDLPIKNNSDKN